MNLTLVSHWPGLRQKGERRLDLKAQVNKVFKRQEKGRDTELKVFMVWRKSGKLSVSGWKKKAK